MGINQVLIMEINIITIKEMINIIMEVISIKMDEKKIFHGDIKPEHILTNPKHS